MSSRPSGRLRWYNSFYWRIAVSFVVLVLVVLTGQSLMVSYARSSGALGPGNPNGEATFIAASLAQALTEDPSLDLGSYLRDRHPRARPSTFILMKDGRLASNSHTPMREQVRLQVEAALHGTAPPAFAENSPTGPVVTAPVQVSGVLVGMVILPPPPPRGLLANVGELLSLPGTLVLIAVSALAAIVIFGPARHRLRALEDAADRLGSGDLAARAPGSGRDEIARVATAFNRMADELAAQTDALRMSDRLRRQMLADISHELRTPLTTMRGYLDTLEMLDVTLDEAKRKRYVDTVRTETLRLERIVSDLLELARFENGVGTLEPRVIAIDRVFDAVTRRYERDASAAGVRIRTRVADGADQLVADPDRLGQVISNLVANALRHTPRDGTIDLDARFATGGYQISIVDSGTGIASDHLPHVFERFYKAEVSRASGPAGSGLGLSIVKAIVDRHGGHIEVTSQPGRTAFVITLPTAATA